MDQHTPVRLDQPSHADTATTVQKGDRHMAEAKRHLLAYLHGLLPVVGNLRYLSWAELTAFLKRTRTFWLSTAGVIFGLLVLVTFTDHVIAWARNARARRHDLAVATVNPDSLIARCGEAAHDVTKQVFPIVMRTMSYPKGNRTLVLTFSRTAEEKSDWVFLSMNDENGSISYETPDAKIAALPCLDSAK